MRAGKFMLRASDRVYLGGDGMRSIISAGMQFDLQPKR